jgi:hypothetical protein
MCIKTQRSSIILLFFQDLLMWVISTRPAGRLYFESLRAIPLDQRLVTFEQGNGCSVATFPGSCGSCQCAFICWLVSSASSKETNTNLSFSCSWKNLRYVSLTGLRLENKTDISDPTRIVLMSFVLILFLLYALAVRGIGFAVCASTIAHGSANVGSHLLLLP